MDNKIFKVTKQKFVETCPDCIQFIDSSDNFILGCYELINQTQQIRGQLLLMNSDLIVQQTIESQGILDLKYINQLNLLLTCTVDSEINFYRYNNNNCKKKQNIQSYKQLHSDTNKENKFKQSQEKYKIRNNQKFIHQLSSFIGVYNFYIQIQQNQKLNIRKNLINLFIGTDSGTSIYIQLDENSLYYYVYLFEKLYKIRDELDVNFIYVHKYSVWSTYIQDSNISYSGSDDQVLCMYDQRVKNLISAQNKKSHQMGISFITNGLITASYDSYLRWWDPAMLNQPVKEIKRPSGVWRVKELNNILLNALFTENQYELINKQDGGLLQILGGHESLAYGCDWNSMTNTIITLSFYDKLLQIWKQ